MQIAVHLGVHLTDENKLVRCLMRNRALLAEQGIAVPDTGSYFPRLRDIAKDMRFEPTNGETQEALLDGLLEDDDVSRVVLSTEKFLSGHQWVVTKDRLYSDAGVRLAQLRHLFPEAEFQIYLAIRDPASFLPALAADKRAGGVETALKSVDPITVRWSELLIRIRASVPDAMITVWREEDTALLWPEILRAVSGHDAGTELDGWFAWYWDKVTPKNHEAMRRYFGSSPILDDSHRRAVLETMLDKFARPITESDDPQLPGWTVEYTDVLSELYEQDVDLISAMPGIELLEP